MHKDLKTKLRFILIGFIILSIPLGFLMKRAYAIRIHDIAYMQVMQGYHGNKQKTKEAITEIDKAIKIAPRNYLFYMNKAQLLMSIDDYENALIAAQKGTALKNDYTNGLEYQGMILEHLGREEEAILLYQKAIKKYSTRKTKSELEELRLNRHIALLHKIVEHESDTKYQLITLPKSLNVYEKEHLLRYDFYIENYINGGLSDFFEGETIEMENTKLSPSIDVDSLLMSARIYTDGRSTSTSKGVSQDTYKFREIFKNKAQKIGFKEIKNAP